MELIRVQGSVFRSGEGAVRSTGMLMPVVMIGSTGIRMGFGRSMPSRCIGNRPARFGGAVCKMRARVVQDGDVMLVCEVICA